MVWRAQSGRASFQVVLRDASGGQSREQLVLVNVLTVNEAPTFVLIDPVLAGQDLGYQVVCQRAEN